MKIKDLLEQIDKTPIQEGPKKDLAAIIGAGALALGAGNYIDKNIQEPTKIEQPPSISQQQEEPHHHGAKPYYKVGASYEMNGQTFHPKFDPNYKKTGVASWYGPGFDGRKTANGDVFDTDNSMMAAHPTLPLPSKAWVTNLENGKKVMVTVTDRGPYAKGRLIDLSRKAAQALGYLHKGTAKVKVEYDPKATEQYLKQVGLYDQYKKINKLKDK